MVSLCLSVGCYIYDRFLAKRGKQRHCYFVTSVNGQNMGMVDFKLEVDMFPRISENFISLCKGSYDFGETHESDRKLHYKGSRLHGVFPSGLLFGGDFESGDGTGGISVFGANFEGRGEPSLKFDQPGTIGMVKRWGGKRIGSQFVIDVGRHFELAEKHVAFGRVVRGLDVLEELCQFGDWKGKPSAEILIRACGCYEEAFDTSDFRIWKHVATVFDVFTEIAAPPDDGSGKEAFILLRYPEDYNDQEQLAKISEFSFPYGVNKDQNDAVQLFTYVLTDRNGEYTFGYCRYTPSSNTCLCILSGLTWTNLFYRLLNHIANIINNRKEDELEALLVRAYHQEVPNAGETFTVESSLGKNKLECICPDDKKLPTIPDNRCLTDYFSALKRDYMVMIFASLICERHVLFVGENLSRLSSCVIAASMLIYPLHWQHIFVPVLPQKLFDCLHAPMPFLIGISSSGYEKIRQRIDLANAVIVDLDRKCITSAHEDWKNLPPEVWHVLNSNLQLRRDRNYSTLGLGDGLARGFLRAMVILLGGYRRGFMRSESGLISFDAERFVEQQTGSQKLKEYMRKMAIGEEKRQMFQQFIEEKVAAVNAGKSMNDEFELEAMEFEYRPSKYSGAKDLASPVMLQQAYESVLEKGIEAWSDIQGKVNKLKESGLRPPGFSPPNFRRTPRPLSAAGAITSVKEKIPARYTKSKHVESHKSRNDSLLSFEDKNSGDARLRLSDKEQYKGSGGEAETSSISDPKLFSDQEMNELVNKRTSVLLRYDCNHGNKELSVEEKVKSSRSLSDLLSLDIESDSTSSVISSNTQVPIQRQSPKVLCSSSSVSGGVRSSQSAANLQLTGIVIHRLRDCV